MLVLKNDRRSNALRRRAQARGVTALAIVWRNPLPLTRIESKVQRLLDRQAGASYIIFRVESAQEFELLLSGAA